MMTIFAHHQEAEKELRELVQSIEDLSTESQQLAGSSEEYESLYEQKRQKLIAEGGDRAQLIIDLSSGITTAKARLKERPESLVRPGIFSMISPLVSSNNRSLFSGSETNALKSSILELLWLRDYQKKSRTTQRSWKLIWVKEEIYEPGKSFTFSPGTGHFLREHKSGKGYFF
jgi:hypothetical protein